MEWYWFVDGDVDVIEHYITPHTLLTFGIKMFFDVY